MYNFPHYSTRLIGRGRVVETLVSFFNDDQHRFISLIGASGTGKTRLAIEAAESLRSHFPDGCYFIDLAPVLDPVFVIPTLAHILQVQETAQHSLIDRIVDFLATKTILLVLDNFEQVKPAARELGQILARTSHCKFMITSQVALGLPQEYTFAIPPLEVPEPAELIAPQRPLLDYSAIALFVDRMQAIQPRFTLTTAQAKAVSEICRLVDGLPLAIELIAAHSAALAPTDLVLLVRNYLTLGPSGPISQPKRYHILYPVLDWCFSRLSPPHQALFSRLGVFHGGTSHEAVAALYQNAGEFATAVESGIAILKQKHLILEETRPGQPARYIMLDAVHEYAAYQLNKRKEARHIQRLHAHYYHDLSVNAKTALGGTDHTTWVNRLTSDIHNLRAAMRWTLTNNERQLALELSSNLATFWIREGYATEGKGWVTAALNHSAKAGGDSVRTAFVAAARIGLSQSLHRETQTYVDQALAIPSPNESETSSLLRIAGVIAYEQGQFDQASHYFERALAIYQALNDQAQIQNTLNNLGLVAIDRGDLATARQIFEEVVALAREAQNPLDIASMLGNLAMIEVLDRQYHAAEPLIIEGITISRALRNYKTLGYLLSHFAACLANQGRFERARESLIESLTLRKKAQSKIGMLTGANTVSEILVQAGCLEAAAITWGYASRLFEELQLTPLWHVLRLRSEIETALAALDSDHRAALKEIGRTHTIDDIIELLQTVRFD